ncbi:hypothetical protein ACFPM0_26685 [Pseudonocardia sulfidoxydans]|uniref:hypothetical protein n=1 Tax=Pseudonocardia sulfidoxydans TaxID=54011 RepID=UPI00360A6CBE
MGRPADTLPPSAAVVGAGLDRGPHIYHSPSERNNHSVRIGSRQRWTRRRRRGNDRAGTCRTSRGRPPCSCAC